jgi:ABC-type transport system involved in cytochrome c biogenesis permease subunit
VTPFASTLLHAALGALALSFAAELAGTARAARGLLLGAAAALGVLLASRAVAIGFLPLTTKYESFLGFALILLSILGHRHTRLGRAGKLLLSATALGALVPALFFDAALRYPSPLLYTSWYALHVPASFVGYAFWLLAAAHALDAAVTRQDPAGARDDAGGARHDDQLDGGELELRQDDDLRWGLVFFSAAMIFGAIWGLVSWGVYFLWDAKIVWSLAAWLYFASFLHLRFWPVRRRGPRIALGALGYLVVAVTYVGTSFLPGSIHSF